MLASKTMLQYPLLISIIHIHIHDHLVIKILYYTINMISIKAKLFTIKCSINQTINTNNILKINVITDSLHSAKKIFDLSLYPYQSHSNFVFKKLCNFFTQNQENTIEFWECPSHSKWHLHNTVDKDTKSFNSILLLPYKQLWNFSKRSKCDNIIKTWKMMFQASDSKRKHFLDLVDSDDNPIEPSYTREGL